MCLIIHKPAGVAIATDLIEAAAVLNPDGWGVMGFRPDGSLLLHREVLVDSKAIIAFNRRHRSGEYVLHLRRRTRGTVSLQNTHPLKITDHLYLVHNGTLNLEAPLAGHSDSLHLVNDLLRPLLCRFHELGTDDQFHRLLALGLRTENKLALLDADRRRIIVLNREHGAEFEGLWLSSTRWIDRQRLRLAHAPQPQERNYKASELHLA